MKKIEIKFLGLGYNEFYQAYVEIYDTNNNLIYQGKTYNGKLIIKLRKNNIYKLKSSSLNDVICTYFYLLDDKYIFVFDRARVQDRVITFLLTDYYYNNLPIERGELYIWQK